LWGGEQDCDWGASFDVRRATFDVSGAIFEVSGARL